MSDYNYDKAKIREAVQAANQKEYHATRNPFGDSPDPCIPPPGLGLGQTCGPTNSAPGSGCDSLKYGSQIVSDLHARRRTLERRRNEAQDKLNLVYELIKIFED